MSQSVKTYVIVGATGGIGSLIADQQLSEGNRIVSMGREQKKRNFPERYEHYICDLEKPELVEIKAKEVSKKYKEIDGLILSAGFGNFGELEQFSLAQMQMMMNVNFLSQALITKILLPNLKQTHNSKIIAIASEASLHGARKGTLYCATKFALRGFMQSLRMECVQSETAVTLINPGLVDTQFFSKLNFKPGQDYGNSINPEQIAKTVAIILQMENNCVFEEINLQPLKKVIQKKKL